MMNYIPAFALATLLLACDGAPTVTTNGSGANAPLATMSPIAVGKVGTSKGVDLTITDVAAPKQIGPAAVGLKAEAGETFVVVSYTLKNTGSSAMPLTDRPGLSLVDAKGQTYAPDEIAGPVAAGMMDDPSGMASDLNPNVSAKTKTAWKVDKAAFDRGAWRVVVATDPAMTFALQ